MYSYICGQIRAITPTSVLIDNQGIGYHMQISLHTYSALKDKEEVQIFTHLVVKTENQASSVFAFYGFADEQERELFLQLVSVSGVGNNTAQLILSSYEPVELKSIIASGNIGALQKVKGIGSKTAQRIIVDLKDKMFKGLTEINIPVAAGNTISGEALSALLTLGFSKTAAEKAVDRSLKNFQGTVTVEQVIKVALTFLAS